MMTHPLHPTHASCVPSMRTAKQPTSAWRSPAVHCLHYILSTLPSAVHTVHVVCPPMARYVLSNTGVVFDEFTITRPVPGPAAVLG